jgi:hypothetical protein
MQVLFPCNPLNPRHVEPDFDAEHRAALDAGFLTGLLDHEQVAQGNVADAFVRLSEGDDSGIYRGWMLKPVHYEQMFSELRSRGISLINDPLAYRTCHYLPESYPWLRGNTAASVWCEVRGTVDFELVRAIVAQFGDKAIILKDYVKSQKHYWFEACFIPSAEDFEAVRRAVQRFLDLQGSDLNEGLVFREYLPLKILGTHPRSGMPLAAEFRIFWFEAEPILVHRYWGALTVTDDEPPLEHFRSIARHIPSRFFTMDVALLQNGTWTVVELGDGQVAGLPSEDLAPSFFEAIARKARSGETA